MSVEDEALPDSAVGAGDEGEEEDLEESDEESAEEEDDDEEGEEEEGKVFGGGGRGLFLLLLYLSPLSVYPLDAHRCKISLNVKSKNALSFYLFVVYCDVVNVQTHFNFSKEIILLNLEEGVN